MENFIFANEFVVNQKFTLGKKSYDVLDTEDKKIGSIKEKRGILYHILKKKLSKDRLPFTAKLMDENDNVIASVKHGITIWSPVIKVYDENNQLVGTFRKKIFGGYHRVRIFKPNEEKEFAVLSPASGKLLDWDFKITPEGSEEEELAHISKKWGGLAKEIFTSKDKYRVAIDPSVEDKNTRIILASAACIIDILFFE